MSNNITKRRINAYCLMALTAFYLLVTANLRFFSKLTDVYPLTTYGLFVGSVFLVLFGVLLLLIVLTSYRFSIKPVLITLLLTAAITGHFTDTYGTVYDTTMLQNALQTDRGETKDLLNAIFVVRVLLLGVVPSLLIARLPIDFLPTRRALIWRITTLAISLLLIVMPIVGFSKDYASFFRVHKPLRFYTNPVTPVYALGKLAHIEYKKAVAPKQMISHAADATQTLRPPNRKPRLIVMVVGETARGDHVSLNGYQKNTFPKLGTLDNVTSFRQMMSCGTSTAYSVPCMFSYLGAANYDVDSAIYQENVLDTLHRLGVAVLWRDNNSDDKGVMTRLPAHHYQNYQQPTTNTACDNHYGECRDVGMLTGLNDWVTSTEGDTLIVLHQMGNHGPAYFKRYDEQFEHHQPVCKNNELAKCPTDHLINAYDNALLATDDFLFKSIEWLKGYQDSHEVALVYASDHGESLGEKGIYLHGMPNAFAPIEQKHVAAFFWPGNSPFTATDKLAPLSHDALTPTLLALFDVTTKATKDKQMMILPN